MPLEVIEEARTEREYSYQLYFPTFSSGGYSFPCDRDGNVLELNPAAESNYQKCISGEIETKDCYVVDYVKHYSIPKKCRCTCGNELEMYPDSEGLVYCYCGSTYNGQGQSIRPRSEWEERYEDDY